MSGESGQLHISHEQVREVVDPPQQARQSHSLARTGDCLGNRPTGLSPGDGPAYLEEARPPVPPVKAFKVSRDPRFVEKLKDVAGLYLDPPEKAIVFSVQERSQIQHSPAPCKQFAEWRQPL